MNLDFKKIEKIAKERHNLHEGQSSHRPLLSKKTGLTASPWYYEFVGLVGEFAFAEDFGVEVDQSLKVDGDGGKDFLQFPKVGKIDIKAAQIPNNLLVEEGHVRADVFVLYGFDINKETAWSVGWTYKEEVLAKAPQAWPQKVINHIVPKFELNHINKLKQMLGIECEYDIFQELGL
jgi:hypothetical protein